MEIFDPVDTLIAKQTLGIIKAKLLEAVLLIEEDMPDTEVMAWNRTPTGRAFRRLEEVIELMEEVEIPT